jgi:DNA-directed RNA polymerase subunit beta
MKDLLQLKELKLNKVQQDKIVEEEILERSIKQRASQFLSGSSLTKKVKDLSEGTKLDFETIDKLSVNDVFKITVGNVNDEATLAQLKDQYNKAKARYYGKI